MNQQSLINESLYLFRNTLIQIYFTQYLMANDVVKIHVHVEHNKIIIEQ